MSTRKMVVGGAFYPADPNEIKKMFLYYNEILDKHLKDEDILKAHPKAVIVPHAGYIYSAFTANIAFRVLKNSDPKRVIVIGPSHKVYLEGASISLQDEFETPFGNLEIDNSLANKLKEKFGLSFVPEAHKEHSTEVQMPFIKYYMPRSKVIEIVYGRISPGELEKIIEYILLDKDNAIVISSDLSHYYDIEKANTLDSVCLKAVSELNTALLHQGCEACGILGIEAIILYAKNYGLKPMILDYRTSADASGDKNAVVGYMSAAFLKE
jgi:AmmeMemoRadiSam system protein B